MEERHERNSKEDKDAADRTAIDILCDHQDREGYCCNRPAEYKLEFEETSYPMYTCGFCFYSYYEEAEDAYIL